MTFLDKNIEPEGSKKPAIPEEEDLILNKFARKVVEWRMAVPAILFIESGRPLNFIASQAMVMAQPVAEPMMQMFFNFQEYDIFRQAVERRENVENLLQKIEAYDAEMYAWEKRYRKFIKEQRKQWKWYQRWFGIAKPKLPPPPPDMQPPYIKWREDAKKREEALKASEENNDQS